MVSPTSPRPPNGFASHAPGHGCGFEPGLEPLSFAEFMAKFNFKLFVMEPARCRSFSRTHGKRVMSPTRTTTKPKTFSLGQPKPGSWTYNGLIMNE